MCYDNNKRAQICLTVVSHVMLLHFGAAEQHAVHSAWNITFLVLSTPVGVYVRSLYFLVPDRWLDMLSSHVI
jgi:hypothetical protein